MNLNNRIQAFAALGKFLSVFLTDNPEQANSQNHLIEELDQRIRTAIIHNGWFTKENIYHSLEAWSQNLQQDKLEKWVAEYDLKEITPQTVAIIMAGNVPLVGFHDFLSVLISGNKALIKQSSKDRHLLPFIAEFLIAQNPEFKKLIQFTDEKLKDFDAVIATGSNNTARYFEYYFSKKPNLIRKNRNSIAVLSGKESKEELSPIGEDIFRYFGLGCRNISKLLVPKDYDFANFFQAIYEWNPIINHHKYANNYDYNKAVYLMSEFKLLENGFLILKEDKSLSSPIACLFFEYYEDIPAVKNQLKEMSDQLQCVVSSDSSISNLKFGESQHPGLMDYADGVDTLDFLSKI